MGLLSETKLGVGSNLQFYRYSVQLQT